MLSTSNREHGFLFRFRYITNEDVPNWENVTWRFKGSFFRILFKKCF